MAAIELNKKEIEDLQKAVENYAFDLGSGFIKPAKEALENCGLTGKYKAELNKLADEMYEMLNDIIKQLAEETGDPEGSVLDAVRALAKDIQARTDSSVFQGVQLEESKNAKVQVSRKPK